MLDQPVTLRTSTLVNLIRRSGADPHTTLVKGATWYSEEAQKILDQRVVDELGSVGLAGPRGIHPGLLSTVEAIARPQLEYYGWIKGGHDGKPLNTSMLGGSGAGEAFVVLNNTDTKKVIIASTASNELLEGFLTQLPRLNPGRGQRLVVPKSAVVGGKRDSLGDDFQVMRTNTPNAGDRAATELKRVLGLERIGGGQLYVAARSRGGTRLRCDKPITYIDTNEGRWLTEEIPGSGEPQVVATPATPQLLGERLRNAQSHLAL